ncbi:MAG TPA: hypothetical protein PLM00_06150 [Spirochaetota bacterium]|nr:hypothetical protein [Spirochaetota bacterium]HPN82955.1 hypothetical protein [Spirochaetota bacterium]
MSRLNLLLVVFLVIALSCTKKIADEDLEASRIRSNVLSRASSATIPDWVLPGAPCTISNALVLTKVFVSGQESLAAAENLARRETGIQTSDQIARWISTTSGVTNLGLDATWCSNHARVISRYWEAWRPEGRQDRLYTLYLQMVFDRKLLNQALSNEIGRTYGTNAHPAGLTRLFTMAIPYLRNSHPGAIIARHLLAARAGRGQV